jgi:uncharacterized BrkB/YihY/UPF0761 family membrane protein
MDTLNPYEPPSEHLPLRETGVVTGKANRSEIALVIMFGILMFPCATIAAVVIANLTVVLLEDQIGVQSSTKITYSAYATGCATLLIVMALFIRSMRRIIQT